MTHESTNFQFEKEIGWQDLGGGVQRQIMGYNGDLMMVKVKFEAGAVVHLIRIPIRRLLMWQAAFLSLRRMGKPRLSGLGMAFI